jgi:hypothetical protein
LQAIDVITANVDAFLVCDGLPSELAAARLELELLASLPDPTPFEQQW